MKCSDCRYALACYAGHLGAWGICPECGRVYVTDWDEQYLFYCQQLPNRQRFVDAYYNQAIEGGEIEFIACTVSLDDNVNLGDAWFDADVGPHQGKVVTVDHCYVCAPRNDDAAVELELPIPKHRRLQPKLRYP